ncbi:MAG: beta-galactosidase [Candidatus Omnitrophica bacterium]|nr:beta-galactosidase [Candidatus Omnitrophota bacterium]
MPKVEIKNHKVQIGSKSIPLFSGEVHYWRLNPANWRAILERVKEMGLSVIATYIPWEYHELSRGKFDFTGKTDPQRNLKAFLELVREVGLYLIIRPGPYIYSEWTNDGVPDYAHKYHRLHREFQKPAEEYVREVLKVIKPFFASRASGNIILLQADNEIDPWPDLFGAQYGLNDKPGLFQEFLSQKYQRNIQELNLQWGTHYKKFDEARPFIAAALENRWDYALSGEKELRRNMDYFEFKHDYSSRYAKWIVGLYRGLGVDIPIYLNVYPFLYAQDWKNFQQIADMVGIDLYPYNELSEDIYEPRKVMDKVRYLRTISPVSYIAEFQSGVWHGRHYQLGLMTPNHYRLLSLSALLAGCQGWNWYMLVNRDNWYMSPINEWGKVRPELFGMFKSITSLEKRIDPARLKKLTNVSVTFNRMQYASKTFLSDCPVLHSLYKADVDYEFFDSFSGNIKKPILFYSGNQWLDRASQECLRKYVRDGGILVVFQDFPRKDDYFSPLNALGLAEPDSILFEFQWMLRFSLDGQTSVDVRSQPFIFDKVDGKAIQADLGPYGKKNIGYLKTLGKGRVLHLGVQPNAEIVNRILDFFNIPRYSQSQSAGVKTAIFEGANGKHVLVAVNPNEEAHTAEIALKVDKKRRFSKALDLLTGKAYKLTSNSLVISVPRKDGTVIELH